MKGHIQIVVLFTVFMIAIPFIALLADRPSAEQAAGKGSAVGETVTILFGDSDEPTQLTMREYVIGAVAAQMPADFDGEALKAQAVLAHTYALRREEEEKLSPTASLKGAVMSDDSTLYNAYFTDDQIRSYYGDSYSETVKKLSAAADYALTRYLTFEGDPIIAAFHAISCGRTESASNAWGENIPYLISVDSSSDLGLDSCISELTVTDEQLYSALTSAFPKLELDKKKLSVKVTEQTEAGCAATVELCEDSYITGTDFAAAAGLPSACFEAEHSDGSFTFTCKGRGHLVGMSQCGAQSMAENGSSCEEILSHYFPNTVLISSEKSR